MLIQFLEAGLKREGRAKFFILTRARGPKTTTTTIPQRTNKHDRQHSANKSRFRCLSRCWRLMFLLILVLLLGGRLCAGAK